MHSKRFTESTFGSIADDRVSESFADAYSQPRNSGRTGIDVHHQPFVGGPAPTPKNAFKVHATADSRFFAECLATIHPILPSRFFAVR